MINKSILYVILVGLFTAFGSVMAMNIVSAPAITGQDSILSLKTHTVGSCGGDFNSSIFLTINKIILHKKEDSKVFFKLKGQHSNYIVDSEFFATMIEKAHEGYVMTLYKKEPFLSSIEKMFSGVFKEALASKFYETEDGKPWQNPLNHVSPNFLGSVAVNVASQKHSNIWKIQNIQFDADASGMFLALRCSKEGKDQNYFIDDSGIFAEIFNQACCGNESSYMGIGMRSRQIATITYFYKQTFLHALKSLTFTEKAIAFLSQSDKSLPEKKEEPAADIAASNQKLAPARDSPAQKQTIKPQPEENSSWKWHEYPRKIIAHYPGSVCAFATILCAAILYKFNFLSYISQRK